MLRKLLNDTSWRRTYADGYREPWTRFVAFAKLLPVGRRQMDAALDAHWRQVAEVVRLPYREGKGRLPQPPQAAEMVLGFHDDVAWRWSSDLTAHAELRLLALACALRAYGLDHASFPRTLAELVPDYLPAVPRDPFAHRQVFGYLPTGAECTIYTRGEDGVDEHGIERPTSSKTGRPVGVIGEVRLRGDDRGCSVRAGRL
jgi:hypothetical protein